MSEKKPRRVPSMRPSMVDGAWDEIPDAVPEDTNFTATVDSKELTSPDPSKRPQLDVNRDEEATTQEDRSALGLSPVQRPPPSSTMLGPPPAPPPRTPMPSTPPPPPVRKPQRSFPAPPPPPPRSYPSSPAPASSRPSHPPPPSSRGRPPPPSHRPPPPSHRPPPPSARPPAPPIRTEVIRAPLPSVPILPDDAVPIPPEFPRDPNTISESLSGLLEVGLVSETGTETAPPAVVDFTPAPPPPPPDLSAPPPPSSRALPSIAPTSVAGLPSVKEALNMRVRVGEGAGPLWGFLLLGFGGAVILVAVFVFLFGVLAGSASGPDEPKPSASGTPSSKEKPGSTSSKETAKPAPEPEPEPEPPPEPMPKDAVERAARGDEKALADLEARPAGALSVSESLAVASGHAAIKRRTVQELGARARKEPAFASSDELARELKKAAADPGTMSDALRVMAELPDPQGADMLYDIYTSKKKGDPTGDLAKMLLFNDGVRKRASPALKVALDLRTLEKCDQVLAAVKEAEQKGDKRSTSALFRFNQKKGCGDDKKADCWACLRDGDELKDAIRAVAKRKPVR